MRLFIFISTLLAVNCATVESQATVVDGNVDLQFSESYAETPKPFPDSGNVACVCKGETVVRKLKGRNLEKVLDRISDPDYCNSNVIYPDCKFFRRCSSCEAEIRWCQRLIGDEEKFFCRIKSRYIPKPGQKSTTVHSARRTLPTRKCIFEALGFVDPFAGEQKRWRANPNRHKVPSTTPTTEIALQRSRRQAEFHTHACSYPTHFTNSEIICVQKSTYVKCVQNCIFGHTLEQRDRKLMQCKLNEDKWFPHGGFKDCEPYLNCKLEQVNVGYLKCIRPTVHIPGYCNVSCNSYGRHPYTPLKAYFCTDNGWNEPLPHCVQPKVVGQFELAPRPMKPRQHGPHPLVSHVIPSSIEIFKKFHPWNQETWYRDLGKSKMAADTPNDPRKKRSIAFFYDIQDYIIDGLEAKGEYKKPWRGLYKKRQLV